MSIHQVNICGFAQMLRALRGQLDKADAHALTTGYSSRDLLSARLAPDMYPLAYSILRHNGVPLGKADYVPHMFAWMRQAG